MALIYVLNGPNLNLLGQREPKHYGGTSLAQIHAALEQMAHAHTAELRCIQSQSESVLIETIHSAHQHHCDFMLFNPAAYTHTSIALRDALLATQIPFIEVHLSNPSAREPFRQHSYFSDIAVGTISGFGAQSYTLALQAALDTLSDPQPEPLN